MWIVPFLVCCDAGWCGQQPWLHDHPRCFHPGASQDAVSALWAGEGSVINNSPFIGCGEVQCVVHCAVCDNKTTGTLRYLPIPGSEPGHLVKMMRPLSASIGERINCSDTKRGVWTGNTVWAGDQLAAEAGLCLCYEWCQCARRPPHRHHPGPEHQNRLKLAET